MKGVCGKSGVGSEIGGGGGVVKSKDLMLEAKYKVRAYQHNLTKCFMYY